MRITVELPDDLLRKAKVQAALSGVSLRQFFIASVEHELSIRPRKVRREPPAIGNATALRIRDLTRAQMDEAMFG